MRSADIPMRDIVKGLTVTVRITGTRVFKFRMWLGSKLLRLAAIVIGIGCDVEIAVDVAKKV
jgi:hypothetical protein